MDGVKLERSRLEEIFGHVSAPNGNLVVDNFEKWFANSAIVSRDGSPIILYHGAKAIFDVFRPSERGTFGAGIYLAAEKASAGGYADPENGKLHSLYAKVENPFRYFASYDHDYDLDSPAITLIQELFEPARAERLLYDALWSDGLFGNEVQVEIAKRGYDGIIVVHEDKSCEVVVFDPKQIKSVDNSGNFSMHSCSISDQINSLRERLDPDLRKNSRMARGMRP